MSITRSLTRPITRALTRPITQAGAGGWTPALWFLASEQGVWYDPSDFTRYMGELGPELVPNSDFSAGLSGWSNTFPGTYTAVGNRLLVADNSGTGGIYRDFTVTPGATYLIQADVELTVSGAGAFKAYPGGGFVGELATATMSSGRTTLSFSVKATTASIRVYLTEQAVTVGAGFYVASVSLRELTAISTATMFQDSAGTVPVTAVEQPVGKMLDKSGRGNHATQATTAQKPVLSARKNLLTSSEQFNLWTQQGISVVANDTAAPDGTLSADRVIESADNGFGGGHGGRRSFSTISGQTYRISFYAKAATRNRASSWCFGAFSDTDPRTFDLTTLGVIGAGTPTIENVGNGWFRCSYSLTATSTGSGTVHIGCQDAGVTQAYTGDGVSGLYLWGAQVEDSSQVTAYQRVTTDTDYDTVGFPHYAKLDRVDDNMTVAAGGGGTTGICVCAAIRAGGAGNARTIFSDRGTNTGYRLSVNASNQLVLSAGNGAAYTEVVGPTITAGTDYVVTGWHDGVNLNVQANAGAATSAAFGTATAGTAGFTIGKDNGAATGYYSERIYEVVYRKDDASSAGDRTTLINYMAAQAGITL